MGVFRKLEKTKTIQLAGICGVLLPIVVFFSTGAALSESPWFSWTQHALSDLGVEGISAFFFNNGIIIAGLLLLVFAYGLSKKLTNKTGAYALTISSLALVGVGLIPMTIFALHFALSIVFFVFLVLALFIIGWTIRNNKFEHALGLAAIIFAFIACCSTIFLKFIEGIAIPEAIITFPAFFWIMIYGIKITLDSYKKTTL